jgi:hypothetical protein
MKPETTNPDIDCGVSAVSAPLSSGAFPAPASTVQLPRASRRSSACPPVQPPNHPIPLIPPAFQQKPLKFHQFHLFSPHFSRHGIQVPPSRQKVENARVTHCHSASFHQAIDVFAISNLRIPRCRTLRLSDPTRAIVPSKIRQPRSSTHSTKNTPQPHAKHNKIRQILKIFY